jgi:NADH-quinone oxidoreductase subunit L
MTFALLVPLFLLAAAGLVLIGSDSSRHRRAKMAAYPVGAAFVGAMATLYKVTTGGPLEIRFYDLSSVASFADSHRIVR